MTNKQMDLGNLTLYDFNSVQKGQTYEETVENITFQLVGNLQFILHSLVEEKKKEISAIEVLPEEEQIHDFEKSKLNLVLPEPVNIFPRSRKLPQGKKESKWQKYAKEKGIKKRKKAGMSYDPNLKTQVARWGKKSKQNMFDVPVMEQKVYGRNPFDDVKTQKKLRVTKNRLKQERNFTRPTK